jgi:two-component sensor histidine kinase
MTRPAAVADLLVVDAPVERHGDYERWLADVVSRVWFASSGEISGLIENGRSFAAVLMHIEGAGGGASFEAEPLAHALQNLPGVPVIFVSAQVSDALSVASRLSESFDCLALPVVPELLRAKVRVFLERDRLVRALESETRRADALAALAGEQVHRGKNLLAIIQSVSLRTVSDGRSIADARIALIGRLRAIARAYQMVTASGRAGAELADIIETELGEECHRVVMSGPPVRLRSAIVQTLTLVMHELVTNSLTYGALSASEGAVAVGWTYFDCGEESYLELDWTERGGPAVASPGRPGFGLSLIATLAGSGAPRPNVSFEAPGFACRLRLSQDMIVA